MGAQNLSMYFLRFDRWLSDRDRVNSGAVSVYIISHIGRWKGSWGIGQNAEQECGLVKHWMNSLTVSILYFWEINKHFLFWWEKKLQNVKLGKIFWAGGCNQRLQRICQIFPLRNHDLVQVLIYCYRTRNLKIVNDLPNLIRLVCCRTRGENWAWKTSRPAQPQQLGWAGPPKPWCFTLNSWTRQAFLVLGLLLQTAEKLR